MASGCAIHLPVQRFDDTVANLRPRSAVCQRIESGTSTAMSNRRSKP